MERYSICSWIRGLNIVKMSVLPNLMYRFNSIPIKIPASYFVDIDRMIINFIWRNKRLITASTILKEKNKVKELKLLT